MNELQVFGRWYSSDVLEYGTQIGEYPFYCLNGTAVSLLLDGLILMDMVNGR